MAFIASLVAATISSTLLFFSMQSDSSPAITSIRKKITNLGKDLPKKDIYNVLILGYGGAGHAGGTLSDANVLVSINITDKKVSLTAIPRDLWVSIPVRSDLQENYKINYAYAIGNDDNTYGQKQSEFKGRHGGGELAKYVFSETLDIEIDHYIAIDFVRFERLINALGGINVDVPVGFTDNYFPIPGNEELLCGFSPEYNKQINDTLSGFELEKQYECRYETLEFTAGPTQMDGAKALKFIRSRHSDTGGGDFARGVRQQAVLEAIKNKLISMDAIKNIDEIYEEYRLLVTTDIDMQAIAEFLPKVEMDYKDYEINRLNISNENLLESGRSSDGQAILAPKAGNFNYSEIQQFLQENI